MYRLYTLIIVLLCFYCAQQKRLIEQLITFQDCSLFCLQFARLGAMLTHSCSLGYNGAVLQALAVHLSLQGALDLPQQFISRLITEMEEVEGDEVTRNDARM